MGDLNPGPSQATVGDSADNSENELPRTTPPRPLTPISLHNFDVGEMIGQGSFGFIYVGNKHHGSGITSTCALKKIDLDKLTKRQWTQIKNEMQNMRDVQSPWLLRLEECITWDHYLVMVTPLKSYLSCDQIVKSAYPNGMPEAAIRIILRGVMNALEYVHARKYIHRGVKGSHILIGVSGFVKLSGFRHMIKLPENQETIADPNAQTCMSRYLNWLAPEMLQQNGSGFGLKSDIYSVGITILELGNGVVPYSDISPPGILVRAINGPSPRLWHKDFLPSQEEKTPQTPEHPSIANEMKDIPYKNKEYTRYMHNFLAVCIATTPEFRISLQGLWKMRLMTHFAKEESTSPVTSILTQLRPPVKFRAIFKRNKEASKRASELSAWNFSVKKDLEDGLH